MSAAAFTAPADPWLRIRSANFELFTTGGERAGRDLVRHFEQVRSFFLQVFGMKSTDGKPVRIVAFHSAKEFQPYRPSEAATAFFHPASEHDYILMSSASSGHYQVATHEYTHLLIGQMPGAIPVWLNEGLAELYPAMHQDGPQILARSDPRPHPAPHRSGSRSAICCPPPPLRRSITSGRAPACFTPKAGRWSTCSASSPATATANALASALKDATPEAAFAKAYGLRIDQIEAALRDYFHATTIHAELFNVQLPKSVDAPEIESGAALPARIALAESDGNTRGRGEQARKAWEQLAKDFPQSPDVEAGWAEFAWQQAG